LVVAKRRLSYTQKQIEKAYTSLFSGGPGQIVLWDLMDRFIYRASMAADFSTNQTFFNEGRRAIVLEIFELTKRGESDDTSISADVRRTPAATSTEFDPVGSRMGGDDRPAGDAE
jgi:hypothetical protein